MRSIRSKIMIVVFVAVLATTVLLLSISVVSLNVLNRNDSDLLLEYIGKENTTTINRSLDSLEQAVSSIYYYASDQVEGNVDKLFTDRDWRRDYLHKVQEMALAEAGNTSDVEVVYYRLNSEITEPNGFLYQYYEGTGKLEPHLMTDVRRYDKTDEEHVGWYYIPMEAHRPVWIGPYDNLNLKMRMISYEIPLYDGDNFLGVVGMDIDISVLNRELSQIRVYQTGSAILFDQDDNIVYQKNHTRGLSREKFSAEQEEILAAAERSVQTGEAVEYDERHTKLFATRLQNGMVLCITAPIEEINAMQSTVLMWSVIGSIAILAVITLITTLLINSFLKPLKELNTAAKALADGNMEVEIKHIESKDEIGSLAGTFEIMATSLKHYFDHFHSLAYTDNLTGLNNKAAFQMTRDVIESEVKMGRAAFAIIVMDVNNLKVINDTIGHEKGDVLLQHVTSCMRKTFVGFPLYRIGGDEFCAVLNNAADPEMLIERLQGVTADMSREDFEMFGVDYQIAAGAAVFSKENDPDFQTVFNRADQAMYENKRMLKGKENVR